ncbi:RNA polymerase sigma factor [Anaerocolumna sp. AGMB13020]|uniref:RNA polymerase sigma factor n=1 Tax=Anaerocolumna sp. AGMB13020 TaxID=3081750 RepID=UPI0029538EE2|nr:RNA polymerase sigma factor [Anaerocolumna sp. AGMB13020]WOO35278.1 RNA polymerase sigma factor [Anaerocolumna sp. AGMB13020]
MTTEELNQLITEHGKHVYSFCCNLTGNSAEAEDLYQDTILKAVELGHRLNSSGNPKSFLMGISVKIWQNHKRKFAIRQKIIHLEEYDDNLMESESPDYQPEKELLRKETIAAVRIAVQELPDKLKTVLYMYYTAEMSIEEIAAALHIPKGTVKSRLHKGRTLLKQCLEVWNHE